MHDVIKDILFWITGLKRADGGSASEKQTDFKFQITIEMSQKDNSVPHIGKGQDG